MSVLTGGWALSRLTVRLDRLRLPGWALALALVTLPIPRAFETLYPTQADREAFAATGAASPLLVAFTGPPVGLDTLGGLTAWRSTGFAVVVLGLLGVLTVARHVRAAEEDGRAELTGAAPVGRAAGTASALAVAAGAQLTAALLVGAGLAAQGLPVAGSVAFGLATAAGGWVFTGLTGVLAQLSRSARLVSAVGSAALAAAFVVRAVGDLTGSSWSQASPIGWAQAVQPYADEQWGRLLAPMGAAALLAAAAIALAARRDLGAGLVAERRGPDHARPGLASPLALAGRLLRGSVLGWSLGLLAGGVVYASAGSTVSALLDATPGLRAYFEAQGNGTIVDAYFATVMGILGLPAAAAAVAVVLRLRGEETSGRSELVLAAAVTRRQWALAHVVVGAGTVLLGLLGAGLGAGLTYGLQTATPAREAGRLLLAALLQAPAALVFAGMAMLCVGWLPRATAVAWSVLAACAVVGLLGATLGLPDEVRELTPFSHTPSYPGGPVTAGGPIVLLGVAGLLAAVGVTGYRRRGLVT